MDLRDRIIQDFDFANANDFIDPVIEIYLGDASSISIYRRDDAYLFSSGDCTYQDLNTLIDDLIAYVGTRTVAETELQ